jgi:hypothetical protein
VVGGHRLGYWPKHTALVEPDVVRLDKLYTYYNYFEVEQRYEISFKEFTRKVDTGTWEAYLAI